MFKRSIVKKQKKTPNSLGLLLGLLFFGYVLGVWNSIYIIVQLDKDLLWYLGSNCIAICFVVFLYFWLKPCEAREK